MGEKGPKGEPRKLSSFRFTSASRVLLDAIAAKHGGSVREWASAPEEGYWEVTTKASELEIILPPVYSDVDGRPTVPYSQFFELWKGGGCQRRCDGVTEALSGKPCFCTEEARACKITTRVSFMLPDIPGLGVWRLESHGYNAAVELPTTLEVLVAAAKEHKFIPAVLTIQHRTKKVPGEGTRRFIVPAITLPNVTVQQIANGDVPLALNAPRPVPERPQLPAGPPPPEDPAFEQAETAEWGTPPSMKSGDGISNVEEGQNGVTTAKAQEEPPTVTRPEPEPGAGVAQMAARGTHSDPEDAGSIPVPGSGVSTSRSGSGPATVDETTALTARVLAAADRLGKRDIVDAWIARNKTANVDDPRRHVTWLKGQVTRMEKQSPQQEVLV